ncbi:MAG TPA: hypothetical protein VMO26_01010 [Vicinamibacterales bacterium]|nr:hypothetical protein [Vicinamibacterales bacterium]
MRMAPIHWASHGATRTRKAADRAYPQAGRSIARNGLRMADWFGLQFDVEWLKRLTERDKRIVWAIAGRLLHPFGIRAA